MFPVNQKCSLYIIHIGDLWLQKFIKMVNLKKETYLIDINDELYQVTFKSYI